MDKHPIGAMMQTTMEYLKDMVDVNTVIGEPVQTGDGNTVIPISKVSFGYVAGGAEYTSAVQGSEYPFAGGSGAGVSVQPMGFLVLSACGVQMLPALKPTALDRAVELLPKLAEDIRQLLIKEKPAIKPSENEENL